MFLVFFCLLLLSPFTSVSCTSSFETFTDVGVSIELLAGHLQYLKNQNHSKRAFGKELKTLSGAVEKFKKKFFTEEMMSFHCGHYYGDDELYGDALRLYQLQRKNPWVNSIKCVLDKSIFSKDYGPFTEAFTKNDFRQELRQFMNEGRNIFRFNDLDTFLICVKQSLLKYIIQEIHELVEKGIEESTGEKIKYKDINSKFQMNFYVPSSIRTMKQAKDIYIKLPFLVSGLRTRIFNQAEIETI